MRVGDRVLIVSCPCLACFKKNNYGIYLNITICKKKYIGRVSVITRQEGNEVRIDPSDNGVWYRSENLVKIDEAA